MHLTKWCHSSSCPICEKHCSQLIFPVSASFGYYFGEHLLQCLIQPLYHPIRLWMSTRCGQLCHPKYFSGFLQNIREKLSCSVMYYLDGNTMSPQGIVLQLWLCGLILHKLQAIWKGNPEIPMHNDYHAYFGPSL